MFFGVFLTAGYQGGGTYSDPPTLRLYFKTGGFNPPVYDLGSKSHFKLKPPGLSGLQIPFQKLNRGVYVCLQIPFRPLPAEFAFLGCFGAVLGAC